LVGQGIPVNGRRQAPRPTHHHAIIAQSAPDVATMAPSHAIGDNKIENKKTFSSFRQ
jgi:hypothetical protein